MSVVERVRESRRLVSQTGNGSGKSGKIGMLGRRQVTPRWACDTVWR